MNRGVWKIVFAAAGLGAFAWYVSRLEVRGVVAVFEALGSFAPLLLLPYAFVYAVDTLGWRWAFLRPPPVSFGRLFRIRWAGEAVSNVIPSAYVGGEVVKVFLLGKRFIPMEAATASVVVSKTAQTVAQIAFISLAAVVLVRLVPGNTPLRLALWTVLGGGVTALALFFWLQHRGLFQSVAGLLRAVGWRPAWLERVRPTLEQMDRATHACYRERPARLAASVLAYLAGWLLDTIEILVFSWLSGHPISWLQALVVEAFTGVAKAVGWFVPGSAGVQESGVVFFGRLAGLPDSLCVAYALFRRFRELGYALAGWGLLWLEEGTGALSGRWRASASESTPGTN